MKYCDHTNGAENCPMCKHAPEGVVTDNSDLLCFDSDHELEVVDASYDHEYGCLQVYYWQCVLCGATHNEDSNIPEQVET